MRFRNGIQKMGEGVLLPPSTYLRVNSLICTKIDAAEAPSQTTLVVPNAIQIAMPYVVGNEINEYRIKFVILLSGWGCLTVS